MRAHWSGFQCPMRQPGDMTAVRQQDVTCWRCKMAIRQGRAPRREDHRKPPRPPYENERGCSMCGRWPLPKRRRTYCSEDCVRLWWVATSGRSALVVLVPEFGYRCWECDKETVSLYVDHRKPLWSLTETERLELRWWLPFNLQLLCDGCHKAKTKREAAQRALIRRTGLKVAELQKAEQKTLDMNG